MLIRYLVFFLLVWTSAYAEETNLFESISEKTIEAKNELKKEFKEFFTNPDVGLKIKFLDVDVMEGLSLSAKYRYELEPSYKADWTTRIDRWVVDVNLRPGDMLKGSGNLKELPVYLNIQRGAEVVFVRHRQKSKEAALLVPYTPLNLPLTAKRAIKNLEPGDFVAIPVHLNIAVGANIGATSVAWLDAKAGVQYVMSGRFLIHVYRMVDKRVRMKVIASRGSGNSIGAKVGIGFNVFGVSLADSQVEKIFDLDKVIEARLGRQKGSLYLIDYVFDLKDPLAAKAYNDILSSQYKFGDFKILKKGVKEELAEKLDKADIKALEKFKEVYDFNSAIANISLSETIFEADKKKPQPQRRVDRIFKGFNKFTKNYFNVRFGIKQLSIGRECNYIENSITSLTRENAQRRFFYPTHTCRKEKELDIFGWKLREEDTKTMFSLFEMLDETGEELDFSDFGFMYELRDRKFQKGEQEAKRAFLKANMPNILYQQVEWGNWTPLEVRRDARMVYHVTFKGPALELVKGLSKKEIRKKINKAHKKWRDLKKEYKNDFIFSINPINWGTHWFWKKRLTRKLHRVFNGYEDWTNKKRAIELMELRRNPLFVKYGFGLLMSFLPQEGDLEKYVNIYLRVQADDSDIVTYTLGDQIRSQLYLDLQLIHALLNNRSYDLRLTENEEYIKDEADED